MIQARNPPSRAARAPPRGAGSRRHRRPPHTSGRRTTIKAFGALPVPGGESGGFRHRLAHFGPQPLFLGAEVSDDYARGGQEGISFLAASTCGIWPIRSRTSASSLVTRGSRCAGPALCSGKPKTRRSTELGCPPGRARRCNSAQTWASIRTHLGRLHHTLALQGKACYKVTS